MENTVVKKDRPVILKVEHVGKKYVIKNKIELPSNATRRQKLRYKVKSFEKNDFWALKDISFEVREGDRLAIVGRNGAGKSTLLKLISRITEPTEGRIEYYGKIAAMLEVGTGFNQELTGRENVYLNGAILGMSKEEIDARFDGIVEFSEIGKFIDTPVKRYSSGMMVRLAFAVASTMDPDILIVDEVLSVGDMKFREKCLRRMNEIATSGKTILCVSHVMNIVRGLCDRAIVLEQGKMVYDGEVEKAIKLYNGINEDIRVTHREFADLPRPKWYTGEQLRMLSLDVLDNQNCIFRWNEPIRFNLHIRSKETFENLGLRVIFACDNGAAAGTAFCEIKGPVQAGEERDICVCVEKHNLAPGDYKISLEMVENLPYDCFNRLDSITPEALFITVGAMELDDAQDKLSDNRSMWVASWGTSRIPDAHAELQARQ